MKLAYPAQLILKPRNLLAENQSFSRTEGINRAESIVTQLDAAVGVPACWFEDTLLNAPIDEVITALGKMALIYLSSLRNMALCNAPLPNVGEDSLAAVATMTEVLLMNEQRVAAH